MLTISLYNRIPYEAGLVDAPSSYRYIQEPRKALEHCTTQKAFANRVACE